jgi:hypothetical protein
MQKQFTVHVPDELWVNSWEKQFTATYTYTGPRYFYIAVDGNNSMRAIAHGDVENEAEPFSDEEKNNYEYVLTIDAEVHPEIAHALFVHEHDPHEFEDVVNHDGSIYKKIINPCVRDYFFVDFRSAENASEKEAFLSPRYKDTSNMLHTTALSRLAAVTKYTDVYDFEGDDQTKITTFIETITEYINVVSTAYPWKYITYNVAEVPKVPVALQLLFNKLPELTSGI